MAITWQKMRADYYRQGGNQRGFTLIELLAVLAILSIITAIVLPQVNTVLNYLQLRKDAVEIAREIRVARHQAIALGRGVKVRFYPHHGYYRVYEPEARKCNLGSGISYEYVSFPPDVRQWVFCEFDSLGTPTAGGTVALRNAQGQRLYVIVNPVVGRVRVSSNPPVR
ncbi:MAG: prepilin-type N-terminal cleavage/methylation domain-containing protein [Syntrophomonadaceae bacterium]|nr:prepilin-type N-terminal cleavage/methylation domain-containing protein [Syntrophomonadaceae bacterium]